MNHVEAERLRARPENWLWGIVYRCPEDPRLVVLNRIPIGWTWNFGHPYVIPGILAAVIFAVGIPYVIAATIATSAWDVIGSFVLCLGVLIIGARRIANGPN